MKLPLQSTGIGAQSECVRDAPDSYFVRIARSAVISRLARIRSGRLTVRDGRETRVFGGVEPGPEATLHVRDPRTWSRVAAAGTIGAAEAYIAGMWSSDDLTSAVRVFVRNREAMNAMEGGFAALKQKLHRLRHLFRANTRGGSKRNIREHYDLSNDFYSLFLDPQMVYSGAVFECEDESLAVAQERKLELICRKLELAPGMRLLEIGTGWGALAIHAAKYHGAKVTTTTISDEQHRYAAEKIREAGVSDRVELLNLDYRDVRGRFDRLVSIEMIEAVGHEFLDDYFRVCSNLLEPHGRAVIQAITMRGEFHAQSLRAVDFIQRFVFPGSQLPSMASLTASAARSGDLELVGAEDFTGGYALTLRRWREAFLDAQDRVRALGFGDEFVRLWEFYLAYCEGGFLEHSIGSVQLVFSKPRGRPDDVR